MGDSGRGILVAIGATLCRDILYRHGGGYVPCGVLSIAGALMTPYKAIGRGSVARDANTGTRAYRLTLTRCLLSRLWRGRVLHPVRWAHFVATAERVLKEMSECPCSYEIRDGMVFIRGPRLLVVLPLSVWVSGIRRGKVWRRHGGERPGRCAATMVKMTTEG